MIENEMFCISEGYGSDDALGGGGGGSDFSPKCLRKISIFGWAIALWAQKER